MTDRIDRPAAERAPGASAEPAAAGPAAANNATANNAAGHVRTVLARGASGTVVTGLLRHPVRSARVRDEGVVALVVDVGGDGADSGAAIAPGATATVEILDTVCTGRCRAAGRRPSFALDGRPSEPEPCGPDCAVTRGIITLTGIVTAGSAPRRRRRRLVTADGGVPFGGDAGTLRLGELRPLEVDYLGADGAYPVRPAELAAAPVDPIGVDEQAWLRRFGAEPGLAGRLAERLAGRPADVPVDGPTQRPGRRAGDSEPWIVGIDRHGIDIDFRAVDAASSERVRLTFAQVCRTAEDVRRELDALQN